MYAGEGQVSTVRLDVERARVMRRGVCGEWAGKALWQGVFIKDWHIALLAFG